MTCSNCGKVCRGTRSCLVCGSPLCVECSEGPLFYKCPDCVERQNDHWNRALAEREQWEATEADGVYPDDDPLPPELTRYK